MKFSVYGIKFLTVAATAATATVATAAATAAATAIAAVAVTVAALFLGGCVGLDAEAQYARSLHTLEVHVAWPDDDASYMRAGVGVKVADNVTGNTFFAATDDDGCAMLSLPEGFYNVSVSDVVSRSIIFNGSADMVRVTGGGDVMLRLDLLRVETSPLVIREIYCGGCTKYPDVGTYQSDKYVIIHNNSSEVQWLDGLCFAALDPYNAQATNVWVTSDPDTGSSLFPEFLPVVECIWQFGGSGSDFPLAGGEDAVIAVNGAIDHAEQFPESVNLNDSRYFVCYNQVLYPNTSYHPVPGDKIEPSHHLRVVIKVGRANAYPYSINSPATIIFRAQECDIDEYVQREGVVIQKPGSSSDRVVKIPPSWVLDAVEVYDASTSNNKKRLPPQLDAGYVFFSGKFNGHTLHRRLDAEATAEEGFAVYADTNNSSSDFYERDTQSLKDYTL